MPNTENTGTSGQPSYTAKSLSQYLEIVQRCSRDWFQNEPTWGPWFRGQSEADWPLLPGMYRLLPLKRDVRILEDEIRQEFTVRAPSLGPERPENSWESYFLMQHSGAPTRLLDWTESALIGLYFAVKSKKPNDKVDAAVWILEPWKLNEFVLEVKEVIAPGAHSGMAASDEDRYRPWLPDRYSNSGMLKKELPVAIYPTHFSRRISSQRSCFTIHGSDVDGFRNIPDKFNPYLIKVVIPGEDAYSIGTALSVAGVDELTIFPDLDGLGRWLTASLREEQL
jgi:hypothetical protein